MYLSSPQRDHELHLDTCCKQAIHCKQFSTKRSRHAQRTVGGCEMRLPNIMHATEDSARVSAHFPMQKIPRRLNESNGKYSTCHFKTMMFVECFSFSTQLFFFFFCGLYVQNLCQKLTKKKY